jgi:hypothetical protein
MFFAKGAYGSNDLTSRVEIRFPYEAFVRHLWESAKKFHEELVPRAEALAAYSKREHPQPEKLTPIKQHSVWANVAFMARSGSVISTDFYYLSPAALYQFGRSKDASRLSIEPRLRVVTTVVEIANLLTASKLLVESLRSVVAFQDEESV